MKITWSRFNSALKVSAFLAAVAASGASFAMNGDSDSGICDQIRQTAKANCKNESSEGKKLSCYKAEVDSMVREYNSYTSSGLGGDLLSCLY